MRIVVMDGQGGKMGRALIEQLVAAGVSDYAEIRAIGTNATATAAMMKAGASCGATGENPAIVACRDADIIAGPLGIVIADSLLGEVTPQIAQAVGQSPARKFFLPVNRCGHFVVGVADLSFSELIRACTDAILRAASELHAPGGRFCR